MINLNFSPATREVHHYTYNGTLIDSHSMGAWGAYVTLFCHGGKIYSPYSPRLYEIEIEKQHKERLQKYNEIYFYHFFLLR